MTSVIHSITSKFFRNSSRVHLEQFVLDASSSLPKNAIMLDAGAGDCVYKEIFKHVNYESADFCQVDKPYATVTYTCNLTAIPVKDNKYDLVLCSQVLEHLPNPEQVLQELFRVLKPNGRLWMSAPFFYEEHEQPYDFYRYTQFGVSHLVKKTGFTIDKIDWLEGYFGTLAYQFKTIATHLPLAPKHYKGLFFKLTGPLVAFVLKTSALFLSFYFSHADTKKKHTSSGFCKNYKVIATKPLSND